MSKLLVSDRRLPTFKYVFDSDVAGEIEAFWDEYSGVGDMMVAQPVFRGDRVILKCQILPRRQADVMKTAHTALREMAIKEREVLS